MARLVRWQIFLAALGILIVGSLLVQLSLSRQAVIVPTRGGVYVEGMVGAPQYLNPLLATSDVDRSITALLFDGLSTLQPDGSVRPGLAQSWEVAPSGLVYTCTLRSDLRWHDGEPVTTEDVLFTLDMIRSPDLPYDPNSLAELWSRVQAETVDERRLRFVLERPYAPFLSFTNLRILPAHLLRDVTPADLQLSAFNLSPVGTGPFRFVRVREEEGRLSIELEANPYYYRQSPPIYLEGIVFRFYRDEGALTEALLQEEVDGAFGLSRDALGRVAERPDLVAYRAYLQAYNILFLNTGSTLFRDRRMRHAVALGLDLPALTSGFSDEVFPANGPISPISWAYKPDLPPFEHDPARAAELLEEAGWRDLDQDGVRERDVRSLELDLLTSDLPEERVVLARRIEQQLALLGIAVRVVIPTNPQEYQEKVSAREFDMLLYGWGQLGRDPDEFALWHSSQVGLQGTNLSALQNEGIDRLLEIGRATVDREQRTLAYWQFQELFRQEVPAIPLYYPVYTYVVSSRIRGVQLDPLNDLGDRFSSTTGWYIKTQKILGPSRSAPARAIGR